VMRQRSLATSAPIRRERRPRSVGRLRRCAPASGLSESRRRSRAAGSSPRLRARRYRGASATESPDRSRRRDPDGCAARAPASKTRPRSQSVRRGCLVSARSRRTGSASGRSGSRASRRAAGIRARDPGDCIWQLREGSRFRSTPESSLPIQDRRSAARARCRSRVCHQPASDGTHSSSASAVVLLGAGFKNREPSAPSTNWRRRIAAPPRAFLRFLCQFKLWDGAPRRVERAARSGLCLQPPT
jgi:hypothetical protein